MAISGKLKKEDNDYKFDFDKVYYKIDDLFIDTLIEEVRIGLRGYASEHARKNKGMGIYKKVFKVSFSDLDLKDFSKNSLLYAAYTYLSNLDEFKDTKEI